MRMDDAVDILIALVQLAVDESLSIPLRRVFAHRAGVFDVVFLDVLS